MILLTDGTVMVQSTADYQSWYRLTPDSQGNYVTGTWTQNPIVPMSIPRKSFASAVLPSGKVLVLGGEWSGYTLIQNWAPTGEIFDPVTNIWSSTAPFPDSANCPAVSTFEGLVFEGVISGLPSEIGYQIGWTVTGTGIPAGTTVASVYQGTLELSNFPSGLGYAQVAFSFQESGAATSGTTVITGLNTAGFHVGFPVSGQGIPAGTTVASIDSPTQIHISQAATFTHSIALTFTVSYPPAACFGYGPITVLPDGKVLAGGANSPATYIYDPATDTWTLGGSKFYNDNSRPEGWIKLDDGSILTYDVFQSIGAGTGYAERAVVTAGSPGYTWSSVTPGAGAAGTLPLLSSNALSQQTGPMLRLQDGRILVLGANGHTAIYSPSSNLWAQGPDVTNAIGEPTVFSADGAPAAILPNGDVLFTADGGVGFSLKGNIQSGSDLLTGLASTAGIVPGFLISGPGLPAGDEIDGIMSNSLALDNLSTADMFGGTFTVKTFLSITDYPVQFFLYSVANNTISAILNPNGTTETYGLAGCPAAECLTANRTYLLVLPNGQVLFCGSGQPVSIYTPGGTPNPALLPAITQVVPVDIGEYLLTGTQLNGQSAGASQGDGAALDENYPIVSLTSGSGTVYYARTSNWSYTGVGGGNAPQAVSVFLDPSVPRGNYTVTVSGAGLSSAPFPFTVGSQLINFGPLSNQNLGAAPFTVSATATSELPVHFASMTTSVCTVSGTTVTLLLAGTCTIQATQPGSQTIFAAPAVNQSFQVTQGCDITSDGSTTVADVQRLLNQSLGKAYPANDMSNDKLVNVLDIQIEINAALGLGCTAN